MLASTESSRSATSPMVMLLTRATCSLLRPRNRKEQTCRVLVLASWCSWRLVLSKLNATNRPFSRLVEQPVHEALWFSRRGQVGPATPRCPSARYQGPQAAPRGQQQTITGSKQLLEQEASKRGSTASRANDSSFRQFHRNILRRTSKQQAARC